jgi:hypothetical protein
MPSSEPILSIPSSLFSGYRSRGMPNCQQFKKLEFEVSYDRTNFISAGPEFSTAFQGCAGRPNGFRAEINFFFDQTFVGVRYG